MISKSMIIAPIMILKIIVQEIPEGGTDNLRETHSLKEAVPYANI